MTTDTARVLASTAVHGDAFTGHMYTMLYSPAAGWHKPELGPLENLSLHPGTVGLHYGQVVFEGLKAHRRMDGSIAVFRPWEHARRFRHSARRMAMPELPDDLFVSAIEELVATDGSLLSDDPAHSLYLRPLMFAADESLALRPAENYRFLLLAYVAGGFFGDRGDGISVMVSRDYSRAAPGGTGDVKVAGNYAPTYLAQRQAEEAGCQQVVWLDAVERTWVEELGGMNLFFVRGSGPRAEVATPELTGTLLPGITRDTLMSLAARLGYVVRQERITVDRWRAECERGVISESFACDTAAVITPVGAVHDGAAGGWTIGDGKPGPVTTNLRRALFDIHRGLGPVPRGWLYPIPADEN